MCYLISCWTVFGHWEANHSVPIDVELKYLLLIILCRQKGSFYWFQWQCEEPLARFRHKNQSSWLQRAADSVMYLNPFCLPMPACLQADFCNISAALSLLSTALVKLWLQLLLINMNAFSMLIVLLLFIFFIADCSLCSVEVELGSGMLTYHIFCIWFHGYSPIDFFSSSHS